MNIDICLGINDGYSQHAGCVMASVLYNSNPQDKYTFYIITDYISDINKEKFNQLKSIRDFDLEFLSVTKEDFAGININQLGMAALYRLKSFDLVPKDKVLYLDVDLIVRHNVMPLFMIDLEDYLCAAAEDLVAPRKIKELNLPSHTLYINSGVVMFNLKQCRKENYKDRLFQHVRKQVSACDQECLNSTMVGRIKPLDLKWNCTFYWNMYKDQAAFNEMAKDPAIIHYIGIHKPWKPESIPPYLWQDYFKYLEMTPWAKDFIPEYVAAKKRLQAKNADSFESWANENFVF